jgi:hypothetical protein
MKLISPKEKSHSFLHCQNIARQESGRQSRIKIGKSKQGFEIMEITY